MRNHKISREKYFRAEMYRLLTNYKIYLAPFIVNAILFIGIGGQDNYTDSVLNVFIKSVWSKAFMAIFVVCAAVYAGTLVEDLETNYIRYIIIRGNLNKYVFSKVIMLFFISIIVMIIGVLFFVVINSMFLQVGDVVYFDESSVQYQKLFNNDKIIVWFILWGMKMGILAGILSLIALLTSLFFSNKMFLLSIPALVYELLLEINVELDKVGIYLFDVRWYRIDMNGGDKVWSLRGFLFTCLCVIGITEFVIHRLKRRI